MPFFAKHWCITPPPWDNTFSYRLSHVFAPFYLSTFFFYFQGQGSEHKPLCFLSFPYAASTLENNIRSFFKAVAENEISDEGRKVPQRLGWVLPLKKASRKSLQNLKSSKKRKDF